MRLTQRDGVLCALYLFNQDKSSLSRTFAFPSLPPSLPSHHPRCRVETCVPPEKTEHDVMDRVEIVANLLEKRALSFFEGFAIISSLSIDVMRSFFDGFARISSLSMTSCALF